MKRTYKLSTLALLLALSAFTATAGAQTRRGGAATKPKPKPPARPAAAAAQAQRTLPLPASDAVLMVDVRKLFDEAVPRAIGDDKQQLAQLNADIEQFKARTGIDARAFDALVVAARLVKLESGATKIDHVVAVANGTFQPEALVAAGRAAAQGRFREEKHGGKAVYVFSLNEQVRLFGILRMRVSDLALSVLGPNVLAMGEPAAVRAAIDAQAGRGQIDPALLNFTKSAGDVIGFAGKVSPTAFAGIDVGMPEVNRSLASLRGFYGTIGTTPAGFQMTTVLRTTSAADAKQLGNTIDALKQIAPGIISMAGDKARFAKAAVESLRITPQGTEVQLRMQLAQSDIAALISGL